MKLVIIGQLFIFYRICHFNPSIELVLCSRNCIKRGNFSAYDIRVIFGTWKEKPIPLSSHLPIFHFTYIGPLTSMCHLLHSAIWQLNAPTSV